VTGAIRTTPFDAVFGPIAADRLGAVRDGIAAAGLDPRDRDAFLLVREAGELLRDLRPDEGLGQAVDTLVAFLHRAYLFWMDGATVRGVTEDELTRVVVGEDGEPPTAQPSGHQPSRYVQLPPLRVWGTSLEAAPAEPLDGWFTDRKGDSLSILAVFGLHPARDGFTAVEAAGSRPPALARQDGSPLVSPSLPGGAAAGLYSVSGEEELLELAWRVESLP
jgi:hypothetical protein